MFHLKQRIKNLLWFNLICLAFMSQSVIAAPIFSQNQVKTVNEDYHLLSVVDLSNETWSQAFLEMNHLLSSEYALSEQKNINWDQLQNKYLPQIIAAEANQHDKAAYYRALANYMQELHDTHSSVIADEDSQKSHDFLSNLITQNTRGNYGIIISKTYAQDGTHYIASYVEPGSPAAVAGVRTGAAIITWNNKPIDQAVADTDITLGNELNNELEVGFYNPSTQASIDYEKSRTLMQAPIGTAVNITWLNPDTHEVRAATLLAADDHKVIDNKTNLYPYVSNSPDGSDPDPTTQIKVIWSEDGNYVQLKIMDLTTGDHDNPKDSLLYQYFLQCMQDITRKNPKGIIVDVRGNQGGNGAVALMMAGFFTNIPQSSFFMKLAYYIVEVQGYLFSPDKAHIDSQTPVYTGPTVVLTDVGTVSAAEWLALSLQKIGKPVLSLYPNTQGAFCGQAGDPRFILPGDSDVNYWVVFSSCRAYDADGKILVDSNAKLEGGVKTDVLIPFNANTAINIYTNNKDEALEYAKSYLASVNS